MRGKWLALRAFDRLVRGRGGYLRTTGWWRSVWSQTGVDSQGRPLPWLTYAAIDFLADRIRPDMDVFEYGAGSSTLWLAPRVRSLISCEHDEAWFAKVNADIPDNCTLVHRRLDKGYAQEVAQHDRPFHLVIIDGRNRVECAKAALRCLTPDGVILWDNTDRDQYREGMDDLAKADFRRLDFTGLGPLLFFGSVTSIFYRPGNCLGV
jgi:hypothetical protein